MVPVSPTVILTAVKAEYDLLQQGLGGATLHEFGHLQFIAGDLCGHKVMLGCGGVGKVAAAMATATLLNNIGISRFIMVGCGGAYPDCGLKVGDIAIAKDEILGDDGVLSPSGFLNLEQLQFAQVTTTTPALYHRFPCDKAWFDMAVPLLQRYAKTNYISCDAGSFVTVSTCSGTDAAAQTMQRRTGGIVENMEGAAVAQVCAQYQVPFSEIRAISNIVEDRDMAHWDLRGAMEQAQQSLVYLFNNLEPQ